MGVSENVGFIATIAVIVIFLSLQHFYRHRFRPGPAASFWTRCIGALVLLGSLLLAWWMMNR